MKFPAKLATLQSKPFFDCRAICQKRQYSLLIIYVQHVDLLRPNSKFSLEGHNYLISIIAKMMTNPNYNRVTAKDSPHNSCQSATLCPNQGVRQAFANLETEKWHNAMAGAKQIFFFFYEVLGMQVRTYIIKSCTQQGGQCILILGRMNIVPTLCM